MQRHREIVDSGTEAQKRHHTRAHTQNAGMCHARGTQSQSEKDPDGKSYNYLSNK
jgi:hypothetical protein